jgi:hypothetical protein
LLDGQVPITQPGEEIEELARGEGSVSGTFGWCGVSVEEAQVEAAGGGAGGDALACT